MFKFLEKLRSSSSESKKPSFTNQEDVLQHVAIEKDEKGLCSQMANLFTKYEIGCGSLDFLEGEPKKIYNDSLRERRHQEDLFEKGEDGLHSAFIDCNMPYYLSRDELKVSDLTEETLPELVSNERPNFLVTYPIRDSDKKHQIAFGKTKDGNCYSFSANFFPKEHPCEGSNFRQVLDEMHKLSKEDSNVTVAVTYSGV
jgi:hypothetical protein